ncbi:hypothetical protein SAMN05428985_11065 [Nocardioides sp. YR527]|nr:hypothetical protein SAMN05428985_11065 [Nocardioides sp. YR527]
MFWWMRLRFFPKVRCAGCGHSPWLHGSRWVPGCGVRFCRCRADYLRSSSSNKDR